MRSISACALSLLVAGFFALIGAIALLHESASSTTGIVMSVVVSGVLALGLGICVVLIGMQFLPRLSLKVAAGYLVGGAAAIITILYTPLLMFKRPADLQLLVLLLVCFLVISLGLAAIVSFSLTEYLRALRDAARRISDGRFDTRVEVLADDELSEVAVAFNRMSKELGQSFARERAHERARRDLVQAVSHDLGTPLTAVHSMVAAMRDGVVQDVETIGQYHDRMYDEVIYLERLIDDLAELSRLESGAPELDFVSLSLRELVTETVEGLRPLAVQKDVDLALTIPPELPPVGVDPIQIQRVITNLIHNAIKYTPIGGAIRVDMNATDGAVAVEIVDSGEGIPQEDMSHVFDRLYRGEKSRTRQGDGAGLGLAIAKAIVEAHGGRIWVENVQPQGARFVFTLPIAPAP
jgi:signal transduction histidine kinase